MPVTSRIILVTGANRGIGNGIVERLISAFSPSGTQEEIEEKNWTIILACRTKQKAQDAIEEFRREVFPKQKSTGKNCWLYPLELDLASDESIAAAKEEVEAEFERVDVLINNAGMVERLNADQTNTRAHFLETYNINVAGVVLTIQQFLPLLSVSVDARIINLSSQTGSLAYAASTPHHFLTDERGYSVAKAALNRITIDLAKLHPQISFYCVCPGFCKTNLNGYQGVKDPVEGARIVEELVLAKTGKYEFGFYAFEDGQVITHDW